MITSIECYYVHSSKAFHTFHRMFYNMPQIIFEYSLDFSKTFPGMSEDIPRMFGDIPRDFLRHSLECLRTFLGMFRNIPRNVRRYSPECWRTLLGMFGDIPRSNCRHSPEYSIPPIPCVLRIPFPVRVFQVLYIAIIQE